MSYGFLECPRCQSTIRPADRSEDGGQWVCYECGLEFLSDEEPGGSNKGLLGESGRPHLPVTEKITGSNPVQIA